MKCDYLSLMSAVLLVLGSQSVNGGIASKISDIVQHVLNPVNKHCEDLQKFFHVNYDHMAEKNEADVTSLKIDYRENSKLKSYNITTAAEKISKLPSFDPSKDLKIYVHGFIDDPSKEGFTDIVKAFEESDPDCNVLALDGSSMIRFLYLRSSAYVHFIGVELGKVLVDLYKRGVEPGSIHLIGHSLGAHISGFAGKTFKDLTGKTVGRISGLDPAGPCFSFADDDLRLKNTDADYVDVIHTDAGVFGIGAAIGDVDYFPNSGSDQPGCHIDTCSHSRVWKLYTESIHNQDAFPAVKCEDWEAFKNGDCDENDISYMGLASKPGTTGLYFLQTSGETPFGRKTEGLSYQADETKK